jgi:hypothetical protein
MEKSSTAVAFACQQCMNPVKISWMHGLTTETVAAFQGSTRVMLLIAITAHQTVPGPATATDTVSSPSDANPQDAQDAADPVSTKGA